MATEDKVERVLGDMKEKGLIDSFVRHEPRTPEKDFSITKDGLTKKINVTCSQRAWKEHYERFGTKVNIVYVRLNAPDTEVMEHILQVFAA